MLLAYMHSFRLYLDTSDITPRFPYNPVPPMSVTGTYSEDLDNRNTSRYYYVGFGGSTAPVSVGDWRSYNLTVVPTDVSGNVGAGRSYLWTVDRRTPRTSLTSVPNPVSSATTNVLFKWISDEDGGTRNISFRCSLDAAPFTPCAQGTAHEVRLLACCGFRTM